MHPKLAQVLSYCFHPLAMATYIYAIIAYRVPELLRPVSPEFAHYLILIIFISTFVVPVVGTWLFYLSGNLRSLEMENHRERLLPMGFTVIFYGITSYFMQERLQLNQTLSLIMLGITLTVLATAIVTIFWKISAHSVGMGGTFGLVMQLAYDHGAVLLLPFVAVTLVLGAVVSARLQLGAHSPAQVVAGLLLGFVCSLGYALGF